jgi:hypothetical protein
MDGRLGFGFSGFRGGAPPAARARVPHPGARPASLRVHAAPARRRRRVPDRREPIMSPHRNGRKLVAWACAAVLTTAACTDRPTPTQPDPETPGPTPGVPVPIVEISCSADLRNLQIRCGDQPQTAAGVREVVVGGQGVYVQLASSNVAYNSGTGQFTFDVTVQNLIPQPLGTTDGTSLDAAGVRVFFHEGPAVTGGAGTASVVPDGFGTFTAAGQPYYQYNEVLSQGETSAPKGWTLIVTPTVTTFDFKMYVAAAVEYPDGYVLLNGQLPGESAPILHPGSTQPLTAVIHTVVGNVVAGTVTFGTSDPNCATVDPSGVVTGVQAQTCTITATAGARTGSVQVPVSGAVRVWDGSASTDWNTGANWVGDLVPVAADSVQVPFGVPNYPALAGATAIGGVDVADQATLSLGAFDLTVSADVATGATVGGGILSTTGFLALTGTGNTVRGRIPQYLVTGTYTLSGNLWSTAPGYVDGGFLSADLYELAGDAQ